MSDDTKGEKLSQITVRLTTRAKRSVRLAAAMSDMHVSTYSAIVLEEHANKILQGAMAPLGKEPK